MTDKKLLTVAEAAQILGLGRSTVYLLVMREQLPSIKLGRSRRVPTRVLDAFIEQQLQEQKVETIKAPLQAS